MLFDIRLLCDFDNKIHKLLRDGFLPSLFCAFQKKFDGCLNSLFQPIKSMMFEPDFATLNVRTCLRCDNFMPMINT